MININYPEISPVKEKIDWGKVVQKSYYDYEDRKLAERLAEREAKLTTEERMKIQTEKKNL